MDNKIEISNLSLADLYALYLFVDRNMNRGFGRASVAAKHEVSERYMQIENELYRRAYGHNPFKVYPADTDVESGRQLQDMVTVLDEKGEKVEAVRDTFVVVKNSGESE